LEIKVQDLEVNPLSGMLISLLATERSFRANNTKNNKGFFIFMDLPSGEYYFQSYLNEYKFDQNKKSKKSKRRQSYRYFTQN